MPTNAGLHLRQAISIHAESKGLLERRVSRRQLQEVVIRDDSCGPSLRRRQVQSLGDARVRDLRRVVHLSYQVGVVGLE